MQADVALMPFLERFELCLQLTQDNDLAGVQDGAVAAWLVSTQLVLANALSKFLAVHTRCWQCCCSKRTQKPHAAGSPGRYM